MPVYHADTIYSRACWCFGLKLRNDLFGNNHLTRLIIIRAHGYFNGFSHKFSWIFITRNVYISKNDVKNIEKIRYLAQFWSTTIHWGQWILTQISQHLGHTRNMITKIYKIKKCTKKNIFEVNAVVLPQLTHLHTKEWYVRSVKWKSQNTEIHTEKTVKNFVYVFQCDRSCFKFFFSLSEYFIFFSLAQNARVINHLVVLNFVVFLRILFDLIIITIVFFIHAKPTHDFEFK